MKNTWKRTIAILLSALLMFTALPMAFAATPASGTAGDLSWSLNSDGVLTVSGSGAMPSWTSASAVSWNASALEIRNANIGGNVTSIGSYAFAGCSALINVTIPNSVVKIENNAFENCSTLPMVTIPITTKEIGADAFKGCAALTDISILSTTCQISDSGSTIPQSTKIYGYTGSTAEAYATKYGRSFASLGSGTPATNDTPAATPADNTSKIDQILGSITAYIQPLLAVFKNLFGQLLANAGSNTGDATSTTGSGTSSGTLDITSLFGSILNSFMAFVNSAMASLNGGTAAASDATTTTAAGGTTAASGAASSLGGLASMFSGIANLFGGLFKATETTTAAAQ